MKHNRQKIKGFTLIELPVVRKRAFTLIELLIASTIFAMIMVIVVGTFSWAAGYNNKLKETRKVAQNSRMILSEISTQVRLANGSVKYNSADVYMGEVILLNCANSMMSSCQLVRNINRPDKPVRYKISNFDTIAEPSSFVSNAILILQKDQNKAIFYRTLQSGLNFNFFKQEIAVSDWSRVLSLTDFNNIQPINDTSVSIKIYFGGYGPVRSSQTLINSDKKQQPFVEFYLIGKSADYDSLRPNNRAKFETKSLIETRYYN